MDAEGIAREIADRWFGPRLERDKPVREFVAEAADILRPHLARSAAAVKALEREAWLHALAKSMAESFASELIAAQNWVTQAPAHARPDIKDWITQESLRASEQIKFALEHYRGVYNRAVELNGANDAAVAEWRTQRQERK